MPDQIALTIRRLLGSRNSRVEYADIEIGLAVLDAGGDFTDGTIASKGRGLGETIFA